MNSHDVIVIGGGWAGVHAAWCVARRDSDARVLLLEASDRLGGRARSIEVAPGRALDLGAHFFGPRQRRITALARRLAPAGVYAHPPWYGDDPAFRTRLEGTWRVTTKRTSMLEIQGLSKRVPPSERAAIYASLARYHALEARVDVTAPWRGPGAAELDAVSVASFIAAQEGPAWLREMWGLAVLDILSVRPEEISLLYWLWYNRANGGFLLTANDYTGGPQEFSVTCGLGGLLERHAREARAEVRRECPVVAIDHGDRRAVAVTLADGGTLTASCVVVAVTPAVAGRIRFTPGLSPSRERLHAQRTGHAVKVLATYERPFWRDDPRARVMGCTAGPEAEGIEWCLDTSQPGGPFSISAFASERLIDRAGPDPEARRSAALAGLAEMFEDPRAARPSRVEVYDWRDHPWVGGGPNTCFAPGVLSSVGDVFGQPEGPHGRLFFASAEYATESPGYVEGALASAEHTAAQVARRLSNARGATAPTTWTQRPWPRLAQAIDGCGDALRWGHGALARAGR